TLSIIKFQAPLGPAGYCPGIAQSKSRFWLSCPRGVRLGRCQARIALQGRYGEVAGPEGLDCLGHGERAGYGWRIGDVVEQGRAPDREGIGQGLGPFGGVEHDIDFAVGNGVDDMRPALQDLVNLFTLDAVSVEMALGAAGRDDAEAHPRELADRRHDL